MDGFKDRLKEFLYGFPKPPPRVRTKPLQVICVGPPRSATESLSVALRHLGLTTYHGWDIAFEENAAYIQEWDKLARRKWKGARDGDVQISREEFDALLGHADAVVDAAASFFAAQLIEAYPEAKVILNTRRDLNAWHRSALRTLVSDLEDSWFYWLIHFFNADLFWIWEFISVNGYPNLFRSPFTGNAREGIARNGKWVYREHCNMIRGLVPKDRLLEWSAEDGWEPLCKFLNKSPPPDEPFPHTNAQNTFQGRLKTKGKSRGRKALLNMLLTMLATWAIVASFKKGVPQKSVSWGYTKLRSQLLSRALGRG